MCRSKAKCKRNIKFSQRVHLPIEPFFRLWPKTVSPTQPRAKMLYPDATQTCNSLIESMIFKIKPLTNTQLRSVRRE